MSEEFGPNFITLTDEDGNDIELEYVDALEVDGQTYMAFFPVVEDDADEEAAEEYGLVILKSVMENGEELLSTLDSDEELDKVYDLFMEQILSDAESMGISRRLIVVDILALAVSSKPEGAIECLKLAAWCRENGLVSEAAHPADHVTALPEAWFVPTDSFTRRDVYAAFRMDRV